MGHHFLNTLYSKIDYVYKCSDNPYYKTRLLWCVCGVVVCPVCNKVIGE